MVAQGGPVGRRANPHRLRHAGSEGQLNTTARATGRQASRAVSDGQGHNKTVPVFVPVLWVSSVI